MPRLQRGIYEIVFEDLTDQPGEPFRTVLREVPLDRLVRLGDACPECGGGPVWVADTPFGWQLWLCPSCQRAGSILSAVAALHEHIRTAGAAVRWLIERGWLKTPIYDWQQRR